MVRTSRTYRYDPWDRTIVPAADRYDRTGTIVLYQLYQWPEMVYFLKVVNGTVCTGMIPVLKHYGRRCRWCVYTMCGFEFINKWY